MWKSIHHSQTIFNYLIELKLCQILSHIAISHIMSILIAMFSRGYRGKTVDFALYSNHHRTTVGHFLNYGKWKDEVIQNSLKQMVIRVIYQEAERSGQPIFCIVDDTIASKKSLRHRLYTLLKMLTSISLTSKRNRIMDIRQLLFCSLARGNPDLLSRTLRR